MLLQERREGRRGTIRRERKSSRGGVGASTTRSARARRRRLRVSYVQLRHERDPGERGECLDSTDTLVLAATGFCEVVRDFGDVSEVGSDMWDGESCREVRQVG